MKWISVDEKIPTSDDWYLTLGKDGVYRILRPDDARWTDTRWTVDGTISRAKIAYWCPLPPKPNKVEMAIGKIQEAIDTYNARHCAKSQTMKSLEDAVCLLKEHLHEMSQV